MNNYQLNHLQRTEDRLSEVLAKAERRNARYGGGVEEAPPLEAQIDQALVQHLTVVLQNIRSFQKQDQHKENEKSGDNPTSYLKDAVLELHELSAFMLTHVEETGSFMRKFYENEDRWLRMITISLVGLLINICADNIRIGLSEVERKMRVLADNAGVEDKMGSADKGKPYLRLVK